MGFDWPAIEGVLIELSAVDIQRFAAEHRDETFYGFAFDCNSEYGQVLLCLNSPEYLHHVAVQYARGDTPNKAAFAAIDRKLNEQFGIVIPATPLKTPEEEKASLRWSLGDWKYQGFNSAEFNRSWELVERPVISACLEEEPDENTFMTPTQVRFMIAVCRALVRLEAAGAFDLLNKSADFKTYVADHDECEEDSWSRLEAVRNELAST